MCGGREPGDGGRRSTSRPTIRSSSPLVPWTSTGRPTVPTTRVAGVLRLWPDPGWGRQARPARPRDWHFRRSAAPDSTIDALRPAARFGGPVQGSGTSQATAIVSGVVALMLEAEPALTPDEVKATLIGTASGDLAGKRCAGAGVVYAGRAVEAAAAGVFAGAGPQDGIARAAGLGSIDSSRGNHKPYTDLEGNGVAKQVSGELDLLGNPWRGHEWASGGGASQRGRARRGRRSRRWRRVGLWPLRRR